MNNFPPHSTSSRQPAPLDAVLGFLRETMPFKDLEPGKLREMASQCLIDFFPAGSLIFQQDVTEVAYLFLIQKGGVKIFLRNEAGEITLEDLRGEGEHFGTLAIIQGTRANVNVETVEDTFCFLFPKKAFLQLIHTEPTVAQHYLRTMSDKMIRTAYAELRQHKVATRTESALYLFSVPVGDIVKGEAHWIAVADSVMEAAARMTKHHIGSLLVRDSAGQVVGIVTDKDLRTKVVARGLAFATPVGEVMSAPVQTIVASAVCFDALLQMMTSSIHHLAVERQGEIIGVLTTHDIMVLQGTSPLYLFREILAQRRLEGVYPLAAKIPQVVRTLVEEGAKAFNIARMITVLNDHILSRILELLLEELGPPPQPFCLLVMGSEGRREQTFKTDQDNAILYRDPADSEAAAVAAGYFKTLGERAIASLQACGFAPCPGEVMASNPRWRMPLRAWQRAFEDWLVRPDVQEIRNATIFFDFRAAYGDNTLAVELRDYLVPLAREQAVFLRLLAKDCLETPPPLSFFHNFIVEKDGEHKNLLDLKKRGLVTFVDFARVMALKNGIRECNTMDRFQLLVANRQISETLAAEAAASYEFLMHLRVIHQMQLIEQGEEPNNHINPGDLTDLEKMTLKGAFGVARSLQAHLRREFRLEQV